VRGVATVTAGDDEGLELLGRQHAAAEPNGALVVLAEQAPDRRGQVLRRQRADDLADADVGGRHRVRPDVDRHLRSVRADDVDRADAGDGP